MAKKKFTRIAVVSDLHCGSFAGLTPPDNWVEGSSFFEQQRRTWKFYTDSLKALQPIDILICNGDAVDGKGVRSGGTELITSDRNKQVTMAIECLKEAKAETNILTYGTPYHTGTEEDWEKNIAIGLPNGSIEGHLFLDVRGITLDVKHKIGSSAVPNGRFGPIARAKNWNTIWAERRGQPNAQITIRSHVHYFDYCGDPSWLGIITPALQGFGSKFGVRECQGTVDFGFIWIDIYEDGTKEWGWKLMEYEVVKKLSRYEAKLK